MRKSVTFFLCFISVSAGAQYTGGTSAGSSLFTVGSISLANPSSAYLGNSGNGFYKAAATVSMSAGSYATGGAGSGFFAANTVTQLFASAATGYTGGQGAGFDSAATQALLIIAAGSYSGGQGSGFSGMLNNGLSMGAASAYSGGTGNGYHLQNLTGLLLANGNTVYTGGAGQGFSHFYIVKTYVFTGNGNWSNAANWLDNNKPPQNLPAYSEVIIDALPGGECILDIEQNVLPGSKLTVMAGKKLRILTNLIIQ